MKPYFFLAGLALWGCQSQQEAVVNTGYPRPMVAFGFVVYRGLNSGQMYFVPLKDSTATAVSIHDFRSDALGEGFSFWASGRISVELSVAKSYQIVNEYDNIRGGISIDTLSYSPVRIVYEIDPDGPGAGSGAGHSDSIKLGQNRPGKGGKQVQFIVQFIGADVLKVGRLRD